MKLSTLYRPENKIVAWLLLPQELKGVRGE